MEGAEPTDAAFDQGVYLLQLRRRNEEEHGTKRLLTAESVGGQHSDRADLVNELVQNAEDAHAGRIRIQVVDGVLEVANDGDPFTEADVDGISTLFGSNKDGDAIGMFGWVQERAEPYRQRRCCVRQVVVPPRARSRSVADRRSRLKSGACAADR